MFVLEREPLKGNRLFLSVFMGRFRCLNVWRCDTSVYVFIVEHYMCRGRSYGLNLAHEIKTVFLFQSFIKRYLLSCKIWFYIYNASHLHKKPPVS